MRTKKRTLINRLLLISLIILISIVPQVAAQDPPTNWFYESEYLVIDFDLRTQMKIVPNSNEYIIEKVIAQLSFFPREDARQDVLQFETPISPNDKGDHLEFAWYKPQSKNLDLYVKSQVKTQNKLVKVKEKVPFPLRNVPLSAREYLVESEMIDYSNSDISAIANQLAAGKTDAYDVAFTFATWIKQNIDYSLSSTTAEASLPASWVLDNRQGVCDELTNLFIAMLRSVGIPAKFIGGYSYTNSELFENKWGAHGWAEVYLPEYGWIPFDVTYGEFGFVDATHIKLEDGVDSNNPTTKYEWHGLNVNLEVDPLTFETNVVEYGKKISENIIMESRIIGDVVGIGSYNLLEIEVTNLRDYYVPVELLTSQSQGIEIEAPHKTFLLEPEEKRKIFWIVKTSDVLDSNYIYTFSVTGYTILNESTNVKFRVEQGAQKYTKAEVQKIIDDYKVEDKQYDRGIDFTCLPKQDEYYQGETPEVTCSISNNGNTPISDLEICSQECKKVDLRISEEKTVTLAFSDFEVGRQHIAITAKNSDISEYADVEVLILDPPQVSITVESAPDVVNIKDAFTIEFIVDKESFSTPENLVVQAHYEDRVQQWSVDQLNEPQKFILNIAPYDLYQESNKIKLTVGFEDNDQNIYTAEQSVDITLEVLTFQDQLKGFFKNPKLSVLTVIAGSLIVFIIVLIFIIGFKSLGTKHPKRK